MRKTKMIDQDALDKFVTETVLEDAITLTEDHLLYVLKSRQEQLPSEKHDKDWLDFSNYVCKRRYDDTLD